MPYPHMQSPRLAWLARDPRHYQIAVLLTLLTLGVSVLAFDVRFSNAVVILGVGLLTQVAATALFEQPRIDLRSPFISCLSLCLLLRTEDPRWAAFAAFLAIASKFLIRVRGKHVFNPTNLALVLLLAITDRVWVSPGQWGNAAWAAFLFACLGGLVVNRAARSDVTFAFLASYGAVLFGRALWLGTRLSIPVHQLENGALLLFAFFMISDPKTTPDRRPARILFGMLVALGAAFVQFGLYRTNGLLWSLVVLSPLVPLFDRVAPGRRYQWPRLDSLSNLASSSSPVPASSFQPLPTSFVAPLTAFERNQP